MMRRAVQVYCVAVGMCFLSTAIGRELPKPGAVSIGDSPYVVADHRQYFEEQEHASMQTFLPKPITTPRIPKHLSLREAILLALRNNPDVESAELQRVVDKFALVVAHHAFEPQFDLSGTVAYQRGSRPDYSIGPNVTLNTPLGTTVTASYGNAFNGSTGTATVQIKQHLLKGAGWAYNTATLGEAVVSEKVAQLSFKNSVITAVVNVINAYRALVQDYNSFAIQKRTVLRAQQTVHQSELQVKAGKIAPSDLLQQKANLATTRLSMMQEKASLQNDYQQFLQALGLVSTAKVIIDKTLEFTEFKLPSLKKCIQLALENNINYQTALIQIRADKLNLISAKNQSRWTLDVTASTNVGQSAGSTNLPPSGSTQGQPGQVTASGTGPSLGFTLDIPIDDVNAQQQVLNARVQLEQAKVQLQQTKEQLVSNVTNQVNQLKNQYEQIKVAIQAVELQAQSLRDAQIKLRYGKSTVFEVNQLQDQLLQQQTSLISDKIQFLNSITTLNQTLGITLEKWGITLRY